MKFSPRKKKKTRTQNSIQPEFTLTLITVTPSHTTLVVLNIKSAQTFYLATVQVIYIFTQPRQLFHGDIIWPFLDAFNPIIPTLNMILTSFCWDIVHQMTTVVCYGSAARSACACVRVLCGGAPSDDDIHLRLLCQLCSS